MSADCEQADLKNPARLREYLRHSHVGMQRHDGPASPLGSDFQDEMLIVDRASADTLSDGPV
jgi:hypothetical protein